MEISFIGAGNMGGAILKGMVEEGKLAPAQIGVLDSKAQSVERFSEMGCVIFQSEKELVASSKRILLGVKPQDFLVLSQELKGLIPPDSVVVSIIAGLSGLGIQQALNQSVKLVLAMPNTPILVGHGATALAPVPPITRAEFQQVMGLFPGFVAEIKPEQLNAIIPVNGSSPAFIYHYAQLTAALGEKEGVDFNTALQLFAHTLIGSGKMLLESGKTPTQLVNMVTSPGGTTIEGLKALDEAGFPQAVEASFMACIKRAKELSENE